MEYCNNCQNYACNNPYQNQIDYPKPNQASGYAGKQSSGQMVDYSIM